MFVYNAAQCLFMSYGIKYEQGPGSEATKTTKSFVFTQVFSIVLNFFDFFAMNTWTSPSKW